MVRTLLCAETAVVAGRHILLYLEHLKLRSCVEDLEEIAYYAERSEENLPRNISAENVAYIVKSEEDSDPQPELECVRNRSERTEVAAPEHIHEEAAEHHDADRYDRHPESDLSLESGCDRIVRVKILAEKLACLYCAVEYPEEKRVLDDAEHLVCDRSVADLQRLDVHSVACLADEVLHSAERADVCAEELAEKHDCSHQCEAHHHLER